MGRGYWLPPAHENLAACDGFYVEAYRPYFEIEAAQPQIQQGKEQKSRLQRQRSVVVRCRKSKVVING